MDRQGQAHSNFAGGAGDGYFGRRNVCELRGRRGQVKLPMLTANSPAMFCHRLTTISYQPAED